MKKFNQLLLTILAFALLMPFSFAEKLMHVEIVGIENKKALENAQNATEIYALNEKEAPSDLRIQWLYEEGIKEITQALEPFGYYRVKIKSDLIALTNISL